MPFYKAVSQEDTTMMEDEEESTIREKGKRFPKLIYSFAFLYFAFSCGMEGFFQSQTFTFGICGPHKLNPKEVSDIDNLIQILEILGALQHLPRVYVFLLLQAAFLTTVYLASFLVGR